MDQPVKTNDDEDRRSGIRFPLQQEARFRVLESRKHTPQSTGRTVEMSSKGIVLECDRVLPVGSKVEIAVNWPAQLNDKCRLKFVAVAKVLRSANNRTALLIEKHEFRTQGAAGFAPPPSIIAGDELRGSARVLPIR